MRILLLGKDGQVGWELQRALAPLGDVVALGRAEADLAKPDTMAGLVRDAAPAVIVNAAAYTAVDKAEDEPELAQRINATSVGELAAAAAQSGALLVHYSTDYVFDGTADRPYRETDGCNPLGVYGRTKRAGEAAIAQSGCRHFIFRTSWVFAARGRNFLRTILRLAEEREQLSIVADQVGAPTGAELIADVTAHAIAAPGQAAPSGIYHLAAAGEVSWHDYARHVVRRAQAEGRGLRCSEAGVVAISSAEYGAKAPRPLNSRLDTGKLTSSFGLSLPPWQQGVDRTLNELLGDAA